MTDYSTGIADVRWGYVLMAITTALGKSSDMRRLTFFYIVRHLIGVQHGVQAIRPKVRGAISGCAAYYVRKGRAHAKHVLLCVPSSRGNLVWQHLALHTGVARREVQP